MDAIKKPPKTARERNRAYRERMRAKGLRPKQIWVWDTSDPAFREEIRRGCLAANAADAADPELRAWLDHADAGLGWDD